MREMRSGFLTRKIQLNPLTRSTAQGGGGFYLVEGFELRTPGRHEPSFGERHYPIAVPVTKVFQSYPSALRYVDKLEKIYLGFVQLRPENVRRLRNFFPRPPIYPISEREYREGGMMGGMADPDVLPRDLAAPPDVDTVGGMWFTKPREKVRQKQGFYFNDGELDKAFSYVMKKREDEDRKKLSKKSFGEWFDMVLGGIKVINSSVPPYHLQMVIDYTPDWQGLPIDYPAYYEMFISRLIPHNAALLTFGFDQAVADNLVDSPEKWSPEDFPNATISVSLTDRLKKIVQREYEMEYDFLDEEKFTLTGSYKRAKKPYHKF